MSLELQRAIVRTAKSDASLHNAISDAIYFNLAQRDAMPYVVFDLVSAQRNKTFKAASCWDDHMVQFAIYDKGPGVQNVETIFSDLMLAFDRKEMTWAAGGQVGCQFESRRGPTWDEDCWRLDVDFTVGVHS